MQEYYRIEKRVEYINTYIHKLNNSVISKYIVDDLVLRGIDISGRVLYVRQFVDRRELFQFICGMEHILEAI